MANKVRDIRGSFSGASGGKPFGKEGSYYIAFQPKYDRDKDGYTYTDDKIQVTVALIHPIPRTSKHLNSELRSVSPLDRVLNPAHELLTIVDEFRRRLSTLSTYESGAWIQTVVDIRLCGDQ